MGLAIVAAAVGCLLSFQLMSCLMMCVLRVPADNATVFYLMVQDDMYRLTVFTVVSILFAEFVGKMVTLMGFIISKKTDMPDAVITYFTKAAKDLDTETRDRLALVESRVGLHASMIGVTAKMAEYLQHCINERVSMKTSSCVASDSSGKSDSCVETEIMAEKIKSDAVSNGSSTRSAALTD